MDIITKEQLFEVYCDLSYFNFTSKELNKDVRTRVPPFVTILITHK